MNTFYRIFNDVFGILMIIVMISFIVLVSISLFFKFLLVVLFGLALFWYWNLCNQKPKNMVFYNILAAIGIMFIHPWYLFIPYIIGSSIIADYITKDGVFEKKELKNEKE